MRSKKLLCVASEGTVLHCRAVMRRPANLPDVTVAGRHLKLRGGGTPNCLFSKRYWRVPTRDRDMAITPGGDRTQAVRFPAPRAGSLPGELLSIPYKLTLR